MSVLHSGKKICRVAGRVLPSEKGLLSVQLVNFIYKYSRNSNYFSIYSLLASPLMKRAIRFSLYYAHTYIRRESGHMTDWLTTFLH